MMTAIVSWICASASGPVLPRVRATRAGETARTCWHCAADTCSSPFVGSGSMTTSVWKPRSVLVRGTTWITVGAASRIRCAVMTTAGWR